jgi:gamma-glutamylputrescine oxidase
VANEPLAQALAESISHHDHALYDTRCVINYWRLSATKRLLFGGGENNSRRFPRDIKKFVRKYMLNVYPQLQSSAIDYSSRDRLG